MKHIDLCVNGSSKDDCANVYKYHSEAVEQLSKHKSSTNDSGVEELNKKLLDAKNKMKQFE